MNNTLITILQGLNVSFIFKIIILIILGLFIVFTFVLSLQIRSLNNIIRVYASHASKLIMSFAIFYFLLAIALFISALVIL